MHRAYLVLLVIAVGCGDAAGPELDRDGGGGADGGAADSGRGGPDGGTGAFLDEDGEYVPERAAPMAAPGETATADGESLDPLSCYDGLDNDDDLVTDCDERSCRTLSTCCVGHGDCCSDEPDRLPSIVFSACGTSGDPTMCADGLTAFGDPSPWLQDGLLSPGGDSAYHGGLVLGAPIDLRTRRLAVEVELVQAVGCSLTCVESAGVALTAQEPPLDAQSVVRPIAALLLSGSRNDVSLIVAGETVARFPMMAAQERWSLILRPTGELEVTRGGATEMRASFGPVSGASLVLYGRSRNRSLGMQGASIASVTPVVSLCDMPRAWNGERRPLDVTGMSTAAVVPRGPSIATAGGRTLLAFEEDGRIYLAERGADDGAFSILGGGPAALVGLLEWNDDGVFDPELTHDGTNWVLFYTGRDKESHVHSVGRASVEDPNSPLLADDEPLHLDVPGARDVEAPTVALRDESSGARTWVLIARAVRFDGGHSLTAHTSNDGIHFLRVADRNLAELTDPAGDVLEGDELRAPSIVPHNGAWQLLASVRQGTRWSQALFVSDDLLAWRSIGTVLGAGGGSGFDRLGVLDADAIPREGGLRLYYVGQDGVRGRLGVVERDATLEATFPP